MHTPNPILNAARTGDCAQLRASLNNQTPLSTSDATGLTPLHLAALCGHTDAVEILLESADKNDIHAKTTEPTANIVRRDKRIFHPGRGGMFLPKPNPTLPSGAAADKGATPMHLAAMGGHNDTIQALLTRKARPQTPDGCGVTPLHLAALFGHADTVRLLLTTQAAKSVNKPSKVRKSLHMYDAGTTPLHAALSSGDLQTIRLLLNAGADPHARTKAGCSSIFFAARGGCVEALHILLNAGLRADESAEYANFPLVEAVQNQHLDMVRELLQTGAPTRSGKHQAPLLIATKMNHLELRKILLDGGADLLPDHGPGFAAQCNDTTYIRAYLKRGGDPNAVDYGASLLMTTALNEYTELAKILLEGGADPDLIVSGSYALEYSMSHGPHSVTDVLLEVGADCSVTNTQGNQILMSFVNNPRVSTEMIRRAIQLGSDPNHANHRGFSPMSYAQRAGDTKFLEAVRACVGV